VVGGGEVGGKARESHALEEKIPIGEPYPLKSAVYPPLLG